MPITRRKFIGSALAGGALLAAPKLTFSQTSQPTIDRQSTVRRHHPRITKADPYSALTVGNGTFAFTADLTGLQTFTDDYKTDFPLCTASHWAWHSTPRPAGINPADFRYKNFDTHGRPVGYATDSAGQKELFDWLRENPHRLHLGRIGFLLTKSNGSPAQLGDITAIDQELNLWTGLLISRFQFEGRPVSVTTACHSDQDSLACTIDSPHLATEQLRVLIAFPYGSPQIDMADWQSPGRHHTEFVNGQGTALFGRNLDAFSYNVRLEWPDGQLLRRSPHEFILSAARDHLEFVCGFSHNVLDNPLPSAAQTRASAQDHWQNFWSTGGCIDLSAATDPTAPELERRIVLSQYNTALHCSGFLPSAETGLLNNSWYGKFHLEMHWWHSVHFAAWNRFNLLNNSLGFYHRIIQVGRDTARRQGYAGCRWPKMVDPSGRDSPSPVAPLLIWQQPHPIYYAELAYRQTPTPDILNQWRDIVFESADFMASFAFMDDKSNRYVLGPPLKTVSENTNAPTNINPTFELAYWRFGLRTAQQWRQRFGLPPDPTWATVLEKLSPLPTNDNLYLMQEGMTDTYTHWNWEHPALLGASGMQPGDGIDPATMRRTVQKVFEVWQWDRAWGWDFPMAALAAARAGLPDLAVQALLIDSPKNHYHPNGHNYQRPGLTAYLPGNGGLLSAVAMMSAGWTNGPTTNAPGFPNNGKWSVKSEGLRQWM